jgi:hypothetical protein
MYFTCCENAFDLFNLILEEEDILSATRRSSTGGLRMMEFNKCCGVDLCCPRVINILLS